MDILLPLRIIWRASLQPAFEKRAERLRNARRTESFNLRDKTRDHGVVELFKKLTPSAAPPLRLVGGKSDGGYLVPDLQNSRLALFSAGVGHVVDFEYEFAERGCNVYLADGTVSKPPREHLNFSFTRQNIGLGKAEISLESWIWSNVTSSNPIAIQMDIEGAEWVALSKESISDETLSAIEWIVVEFHGMERLWEDEPWRVMSSVLNRVLMFFMPVAVHANNCAPGMEIDGRTFPSVFEVTFLNRRAGHDVSSKDLVFPSFRNCPNRPPIEWPIAAS